MPFDYNCTTLVQTVEKYPCIWNRRDLDYRNKAVKDRSWSEICHSLEPNFDSFSLDKQNKIEHTLREKWSNIRDTMVRYLRQRCSKPNAKRYHYADVCHFLEKVYAGSYDGSDVGVKGGEEMMEFDPGIHSVMCVLGDEGEESTQEYDARVKPEPGDDADDDRSQEEDRRGFNSEEDSPPPAKRLKIQNHPDSSYRGAENPAAQPPAPSRPDEDEAFFISVLPHVRLLTRDAKLDFRMGVLQMIKDGKKIRAPSDD